MDQTKIDVTEVDAVQVGDTVTIIGRDGAEKIGVRDLCAWSGEIPWEVFCAITKRVKRYYKEPLVS